MTDVTCVGIAGPGGRHLVGTLHRPATPRADAPPVLLCSPGVKMRVGPGRLYVPLTERLTARGHVVLRFDYHGLGDSDGDLDETLLADVYSHIESGRFVPDAAAALAVLRDATGAERFLVGGLCGGAVTALLLADEAPEVVGLLAVGITVTLSSDAGRPPRAMTHEELEHRWHEYLRRLRDPRAWLRLLTFRSELRVIGRAMADAVRPRPAARPGAALLADVNPRFAPAFFRFVDRGGRALLAFGGQDRMLADWHEKFVAVHPAQMARARRRVVEHVIPGANHVLTRREWRADLLAAVDAWLDG